MAHRDELLIGSPLFGSEVFKAMQRGEAVEQISKLAIVHDYIGSARLNIYPCKW